MRLVNYNSVTFIFNIIFVNSNSFVLLLHNMCLLIGPFTKVVGIQNVLLRSSLLFDDIDNNIFF